jgi:hypothetical protein
VLGVAGTPFVEAGQFYDFRFTSVEHVSGACQLFRRQCFDQIGGYTPVAGGGIDWIAVTTARMHGWRTRTFLGRVCQHHRTMGTATKSSPAAWFSQGCQDRYLGGHPLWQLCRCLFQMARKPYIIGGLLLLCGYVSTAVTGPPTAISPDLVRFHRREQLARLSEILWRQFSLSRHPRPLPR